MSLNDTVGDNYQECMMFPYPLLRFFNWIGLRKDTLVCMLANRVWCWPAKLGDKTIGKCAKCGRFICYERQNHVFKVKICTQCDWE